MKRFYSILLSVFFFASMISAQELVEKEEASKAPEQTPSQTQTEEDSFKPGFRWSVGGEVVSQYIWRGLNSGGLSFQPSVEIGWEGYNAGFTLGAWGNLGGINEADEWTQKYFGFGGKYGASFNPELDVYVGFNVRGFSMTLTHYHYFDRPWYEMGNEPLEEEVLSEDGKEIEEVDIDGWSGNQLEITAQYRVSDEIPLTISWNTILAGTDGYYKKDGKAITHLEGEDAQMVPIDDEHPDMLVRQGLKGAELKHAFSTYIEVSYDVYLNDVLTLTPTVGFTPWRSMYTNYERKFAVNNLNLRLQADLQFNYAAMNFFVQPFLNFDDIKHFEYGKNFSWVIGLGFWFGNK